MGRFVKIGLGVVLLASLAWAVTAIFSGGSPKIEPVSQTINFGSGPLNEARTQPVAWKNTGSADLVISSLTVTAAELFAVEPASLVIAPGASGQATVTFTPKSAGTTTATLTLTCNAPETPKVEIFLSGKGEEGGGGQDPFWIFDELDKTSRILKTRH